MSEHSQHSTVKIGSDRGFGLVFSLVFFVIGIWPAFGAIFSGGGMESGMRGGDLVSSFALLVDRLRFWSLWVSSAFLVPALLRPGILHPLNVLWFRFGLMLGGVVAPVVMGVIYFATVTPTGLLMRLFGKDLLRTRLDPKSETYWVERAPEPVEPNEADAERGRSMRDQF